MARKNRNEQAVSERKARSGGGRPLEFLAVRLENIDVPTLKQHIFYLILASLLTKFLILVATPTVFHSFVDLFDIGFYFERGVALTQGQLPYIHYFFDYPILIFIPIMLALIPALIFQNAMAFVYIFQLLMIVCDLVTTLCVYIITLKLQDKKTALYAGLTLCNGVLRCLFRPDKI